MPTLQDGVKNHDKVYLSIDVFGFNTEIVNPKLKHENRCGYMAGNRSRFSEQSMAGSPIFSVHFTKSKDSS